MGQLCHDRCRQSGGVRENHGHRRRLGDLRRREQQLQRTARHPVGTQPEDRRRRKFQLVARRHLRGQRNACAQLQQRLGPLLSLLRRGFAAQRGERHAHALRTEQLRRRHLHRRRHVARDRNQCPAQRGRQRGGDDRRRRDAGDRWARSASRRPERCRTGQGQRGHHHGALCRRGQRDGLVRRHHRSAARCD